MQNFAHTAKPLRGGVGLLFIVTLYYSFKSILHLYGSLIQLD